MTPFLLCTLYISSSLNDNANAFIQLAEFEVNKNFQQALYAWFIEVFALPSSLLLSYFLPYKLFYSKVFS